MTIQRNDLNQEKIEKIRHVLPRSAFDVGNMSEQECQHYVEHLLFAGDVFCPYCQSTKISLRKNKNWRCNDCRKEFSLKSGTILHGYKLSYKQILFGVALICAEGHSGTTQTLSNNMGVDYDTALKFRHAVNFALMFDMYDVTDGEIKPKIKLSGETQMDATGIHPRPRRLNYRKDEKTEVYKQYKKKLKKEKSFCIMGIISKTEKRQFSYLVEGERQKCVKDVVLKSVEQGSVITTDSAKAYVKLPQLGFEHNVINHSVCFVDSNGVNTNAAENMFARIKGFRQSMKHFSKDHIQAYLSYFDFKANCQCLPMAEKIGLMAKCLFKRLTQEEKGWIENTKATQPEKSHLRIVPTLLVAEPENIEWEKAA